MSLIDLTKIPGFAEAQNEEATNRELAFLPTPPSILGVPIRHYNSRHHILLVGCGCRFLHGGALRPEDVAMFLWFLSPEYVAGDTRARAKFVKKRVGRLPFYAAVAAINDYLKAVLQDWPAGRAEQGKEYTASVASLVDWLAAEYGWSDDAILEMPLARVFQYTRRIALRHNPQTIMFNPSDSFLSKYLRDRMAGPS